MAEPAAPVVPLPATNGEGTFPAPDAAGELVAAIAQAETVSADEIALYDRQIRLWGLEAQNRIRNANILLVSVKALANEIAKNLVLAGIGSITLADHEIITEEDLSAQFFISETDIGKNRAEAAAPKVQKLNPRVKVNVVTCDVSKETDTGFFTPFDMIIATDLDFIALTNINGCARIVNRPFYAGGSHGMYGYIFADLGCHEFVIEREVSRKTELKAESATRSIIGVQFKKENAKNVELVTKRELYTPLLLSNTSPLAPELQGNTRKLKKVHPLLTCVRTLWEWERQGNGNPTRSLAELAAFSASAMDRHKELTLPPQTLTGDFLKSFLHNLGSEIAPVTAYLGGQLAQDVINVLGKREQPIQNLMLFDGEDSSGPVYALHPIFVNNPVPPIAPLPVDAPIVLA
ncbi:E1 ubiquitin-activating protein aos1 [Didymosphaeria variabile]|uniref:Ubiquitin-like 1-activating enzyme E1A n=1 Tax=Didymosphaeria variabile TaxID=1932322 RepID=A0A9W8XL25_9PLEO|nr:E1 ubiquitin-activating protein aos1 [Didymosphaeria variabile]KAJ4353875.1 E1 ubiquitin-activating protein aos1 [Didymosphaeria variabile]